MTVDLESSCMINKKASDTTDQVTTNQSLNDLDKPKSSQSCLDSFIVDEAVTDAEIMWALEIVLKKFHLFHAVIFKDSQAIFKEIRIAEKFTSGSTKCSYAMFFYVILFTLCSVPLMNVIWLRKDKWTCWLDVVTPAPI